MLRDGTPFKDIHAAVEVSPKFVQLVRADLHALIRFHDIEEQKADKRVSAIPKARRDAILLGIVDADMDMKSLDPDPRSTPAPSF
jgi:hypothetical protein